MDTRVVKRWIKNIEKMVWIAAVLMCLVWGVTGCVRGGEDMTDTEGSMQWEDPWEKRFDTRVISQEYRDELGNSIVYYCCRTTYVEESQRNGSADHPNVDQRALEVVIDFDQASGHRDCKVGDWPAVLCEKDGRTYLCWTISPEYSCVIKYDAEAVAEEDIFRMAESVTKQ